MIKICVPPQFDCFACIVCHYSNEPPASRKNKNVSKHSEEVIAITMSGWLGAVLRTESNIDALINIGMACVSSGSVKRE